MNQQEATRAVIVCGLRAGRTMQEIMSYMETSIRALFTMLKESLNISSTNMRIKCQRMPLDTRKLPLQIPSGRHFCPRQQEDAGLVQGEPYGGVDVGDLASQLS